MSGIGVDLNKIFGKNTVVTTIIGSGYSLVVTVAPMFLVIGNILIMGKVLGYAEAGYIARDLFSCTILYIFIFALLTAAPFNPVLSRYLSDVIYEESYQDILPCFYVGLLLNIVTSCLVGIPFCIWEYIVGNVDIIYIFTGFCGYIALVLVFYAMLYLSICKDYKKISIFFFIGMAEAFLLAVALVFIFGWDVTYSMLFSIVVGFFTTACLEIATIKQYFKRNSNQYSKILSYFKKCWKLMVTNFLYTLGLFIHNFVFWTTDMKMVVADSFVCAPTYDMATCIAMFTNISSSVIFITRIEMHFHQRYKAYSEAVIGGRGADIENTKKRMFAQLAGELMNLVRVQFIVSVVVYLICIVFLPQFGFSGLILKIYPCLAAGYFILFVMYAAIIFLYYYNDLNGAMVTSVCFCLGTFLGTIVSMNFIEIWYGAGLIFGALTGWSVAYARLRWVERNLDVHTFCKGVLLKKGKGTKPPQKVYERTSS